MFENFFRTHELAGWNCLASEIPSRSLKRIGRVGFGQGASRYYVGRKTQRGQAVGGDARAAERRPGHQQVDAKDSDYAIALPQFVQEEVAKGVRMDGVSAAGLPVAESPRQ
jgi:hypothetical protein